MSSKQKTQHVIAILDRSGSMGSSISDVIGGYNAYIDDVAKDKTTKTLISLYTFNENVTCVERKSTIANATRLTHATFKASGTTALYDAIGTALTEFDAGAKKQHKNGVLFIFTDGMENSSRQYSSDAVRELIKSKEGLGWTVIYMGTDHNAWSSSSKIGVRQGNTLTFARGAMGQSMSYAASATLSTRQIGVDKTSMLAKDGLTAEESFEQFNKNNS